MGCTPSKYFDSSTADDPVKIQEQIKSAQDEKALEEIMQPPPKLVLEVGSAVHKFDPTSNTPIPKKSIVFLFGGPGSLKGLIADELEQEFGFNIITATEIVISYLPNKVANTVTTVAEIQELLKNDAKLLTVEWIMNLISAKISTSNQQLFLIDIVPSLTSIMQGDSFSKNAFQAELTNFERRHPITFAFNLIATSDVLGMKAGPGMTMKPREKGDKKAQEDKLSVNSSRPSSAVSTSAVLVENGDGKENGASGEETEDAKENGEKEAKSSERKVSLFAAGTDEADSSRLQRRNDQYRKVALPFLQYFSESSRLATLHVSTRKKAHICNKACKFFVELGYKRKEQTRVVLFVFDVASVAGLDTMYYKMNKLEMSSVINNNSQTMESMIKQLRRHIEQENATNDSRKFRNYLVLLDNLSAEPTNKYRQINFLEVRECYLDKYIQIKSTSMTPEPYKLPFKSVATIEDEVCLFPQTVDTDLCKQIAFVFARAPLQQRKQPDKVSVKDNVNAKNYSRVAEKGLKATNPTITTTASATTAAGRPEQLTTTKTDPRDPDANLHSNGLIPGGVPVHDVRPATATTRLSSDRSPSETNEESATNKKLPRVKSTKTPPGVSGDVRTQRSSKSASSSNSNKC